LSEKTEQPTPKRLRDARRKGQVARSRLLSAGAATAGGMVAGSLSGGTAAARLHAWTAFLFLHPQTGPKAAISQGLSVLAGFALPVLLGAFAASLAASTAMAGLQVNPGLVVPKLERVDPGAGLKKVFSVRQLKEVAKALIAVAIVGWIVWSGVRNAGPQGLGSIRLDGGMALRLLLHKLAPLAMRAVLALFGLGVLDYLWARRVHLRELMMTRQERRDEHKEAEGDPRQKAKRRALQRQILFGGRSRGVQQASCVVVNPTHIAVALRYQESEADAPYIVAKGREHDALLIRRRAAALGIPVVKDVPLARSLIHYDVGEEIPEELYQAAAAVLRVAMAARADVDSGRKS
jgi:type III secretion protein U